MENAESRVTIHMVASLDGFIARRDGRVDWLETSDTFEGGDLMTPDADEVRYSIVPALIGDGISFFQGLEQDVALHLVEAKPDTSGIVALRYEVRRQRKEAAWQSSCSA
jgi:dihydrofolate reductase